MESSSETNNTISTTTNISSTMSMNTTNGCSSNYNSPKSTCPSPPQTPGPPIVISPCAACKILRRRCADKCVLAPYFPPTDPNKFTIAHRVFGASNIIKFLQELPECQRADAVSSMVYEASARVRDPVYGCAGAICHLQKQVSELQAQLAKAQAEVVNVQCQQANLVALICMEMAQQSQQQGFINNININNNNNNDDDSTLTHHQQQQSLDQYGSFNNNNIISTSPALMFTNNQTNNSLSFLEDNTNLGLLWEPLWT